MLAMNGLLLVFVLLAQTWMVIDASSAADQPSEHAAMENRTRLVRYSVFSFNWHHVETPLTVALWIFVVIIAKILFHLSQKFASLFPDSALLIVLGLLLGTALSLVHLGSRFHLSPNLFFLYLLPPIVLDAGYFMPTKIFFENIVIILIYAVIGTIWNTVTIGGTLYVCQSLFSNEATPLYSMQMGILEILLFSAIVSAVDPVAVLGVFEEIHVNELLYICVFGESLLNDAVTVVLFNMLGAFAEIGAPKLEPIDFVAGGCSFFVVALGGVLFGLIAAMITSFVTKHTQHLTVVQPLICLLFPWMAYLLSEMVHVSGIMATVTCGLIMKQYTKANISRKSNVTVSYFLKTLSSSSEAIIFVFLGVSTISESHKWNWPFVLITLASCLVFRFIGVFALTAMVNPWRIEKIQYVDQFIMAYGGLRGAVAYGLVMSIDRVVVPAQDIFVTCTIAVIMFTVFIQGLSIKPLVYWLHVRLQPTDKKATITETMFSNMQQHLMSGVEEIIGYRGHYWLNNAIASVNQKYIRPLVAICPRPKGFKIVETYEKLNVQDAINQLRKYESSDLHEDDTASSFGPDATASVAAHREQPPVDLSQTKKKTVPPVRSLGDLLRTVLPPASPSWMRRYSRQLMASDVDQMSMNPHLKELRRQNAMPAIDEDDASDRPPLLRSCSLAPPSKRTPLSQRQFKSVDDEDLLGQISGADDDDFIEIPGPLRRHPASDNPVQPIFVLRKSSLEKRNPSASGTSAVRHRLKDADGARPKSISTIREIDETVDATPLHRHAGKSLDDEELKALLSRRKSRTDDEKEDPFDTDKESTL